MSFNLQHKQYYIYNRQSTKEEYEKFMALLSSQKNVEKFKNELRTLEAHYPQKYIHGTQNENVSGDYLSNCKNVQQSYDSNDIWDGKYIYQSFGTAIKDSMDCNECGEFTQLMYESSTCGYNANNILFSSYCLDQCSDLLYCDHCHFSSNLFGCVGLRRKKFCILNKQYTQEEYEDVVPKIIEHMKKTGEWGEYFPIKFSPSAYNESLAQDYTPLTKEEARTRGYRWHDDLRQKIAQTYQIPDDIKMVKDDITQTLLACKECGINFKIIPQELAFYKHQNIPIPNKCFYCRHRARRLSRNPRKLWARTCAKCNTSIQTSYTPERPEMVLCEKCYLETVY